jgi:cell division protein FtsL
VLVQLAASPVGQRLRLRAFARYYVVGGITVVLAVGNLMLSAQATQTSYELDQLQSQHAQLQAEQQQLRYQSATLHTPAKVQQEAQGQGMTLPTASGYLSAQPLPFDLAAPLTSTPAAGSVWQLVRAAVDTVLGAPVVPPAKA